MLFCYNRDMKKWEKVGYIIFGLIFIAFAIVGFFVFTKTELYFRIAGLCIGIPMGLYFIYQSFKK